MKTALPKMLVDVAGLAAVRIGVRLMGILVGWVVALRLGPEGLGQLSIPNLLLSFGPFLGLGFADGLVRELPCSSSKAEEQRLKATALTMTMGGALVALFILLVPARAFMQAWIPNQSLLMVSLAAFLMHAVYKYVYSDLVGSRQVFHLGIMQLLQGIVRSLVVLSLLFLLPEAWRVLSLHVGATLSFAFCVVWVARRVHRIPRPSFDRESFWKLARSGPGIALAAFSVIMLVVGDRMLLKSRLPLAQMGLYEQAVLIRDALLLLPAIFMTLLLPDFSKRNQDPAEHPKLKRRVRQHSWTLACLVPVFLGFIALLVDPVTRLLLPKFSMGIPLYQVTVLSMVPIYFAYILMSLLLSRKRSLIVSVAAFVPILMITTLDVLPQGLLPSFFQTSTLMEPLLAAGFHAALGFHLFAFLLFFGGRKEIEMPLLHIPLLLVPGLLIASSIIWSLQTWPSSWLPVWTWLSLSSVLLVLWYRFSGVADSIGASRNLTDKGDLE